MQVADFATPNLTEAKFLTGQMQNDPDLAKLAHEVERLLRPGGRAVITGVELMDKRDVFGWRMAS